MPGEHWPYPVAIAWKRAAASLEHDHDTLFQYRFLEDVWSCIQRLLALQLLGGMTPRGPESTAIDLDGLAQPSLGHWARCIDSLLKAAAAPSDAAPLRAIGDAYRLRAHQPGAFSFLQGINELLECRDRLPRNGKVSVQQVFAKLGHLRTRAAHRATWSKQKTLTVVQLMRTCVEELLSLDTLRDSIRVFAVNANGERIALDGSQALELRKSVPFWGGCTMCGGADGSIDLQGLCVVAACPHCREVQVHVLEALGDWRNERAASAASYRCAGCDEVARVAAWSRPLARRLATGTQETLWIENLKLRHRATINDACNISLDVFNPALAMAHEVTLETELPDDVDQLGATSVVDALPPRSQRRIETLLAVRQPGRHEVRLSLKWLERPAGAEQPARTRTQPIGAIWLDADRRGPGQLVGRETEAATLHERLLRASQGMGGSVVIEGDEGIGVAALTRDFVARAPADVVVLQSRIESDELRPFQPLTELVLKYARYYLGVERLSDGETTEDVLLFSGSLLEAVARVSELAGFAYSVSQAQPATPTSTTELEQRAAVALVDFFQQAANQAKALVICVERVDEAQPGALRILRTMLQGIERRRWMIVFTQRVGAAAPDGERCERLARLLGRADLRLGLKPLSAQDVAGVLAQRYPRHDFPPELVNLLWQASRGVPLYLMLTLDSLESGNVLSEHDGVWHCTTDLHTIDLPAEAARFVEHKLNRLPPDYLDLVRQAAVVGPRFGAEVLAAVQRTGTGAIATGDQRWQMLRTLGELERTYRVIVDEGGEFEFTHRKLWDLAYHQLPAAQRALLHGLVVDHLQKQQPPSVARDLVIADHALRADRLTVATRYLLERAPPLLERGRWDQVHGLLERALALAQKRVELDDDEIRRVMALTALARHGAGQVRDAIELDAELAETAHRSGAHDLVSQARLRQARGAIALEDFSGAERAARQAIEAARAAKSGDLEIEALAVLATALRAQRRPEAEAIARECVALCDQTQHSEVHRADCLLTLARLAFDRGDCDAALEHATTARQLYRDRGAASEISKAEFALSWIHERCGRLPDAVEAARAVLERREADADVVEVARANLRLGQLLTRTGAMVSAREHIARARRFWQQVDNNVQLARCWLAEAELEFEIDRSERAEELAAQAVSALQAGDDIEARAIGYCLLLRSQTRHGSTEQVEATLQAARTAVDATAISGDARLDLDLCQVAALRFLRRHAEALAMLEQHRAGTVVSAAPRLAGRWHLESALIKRALGQSEQAVEDGRIAVQVLSRSGDEMLVCLGQTALAVLLVDCGDHASAEPMLNALRQTCEEFSDQLGVAICERELGRIAAARGQREKAERHLEVAQEILDRISDFRGIGILSDLREALELNGPLGPS